MRRCASAAAAALEERPLWANAREDADAHQHTKKILRQGLRRERSRNRAIGLACPDARLKESFDADECFRNHLAKRGIVRRSIERRVDKHASFPVALVEQAFHDLLKKGLYRLERRQGLATSNSVGDAVFDVVIQGLFVERAVVAERVIEARRRNARMLNKVPDRGRS
jgi:hypothetical protein